MCVIFLTFFHIASADKYLSRLKPDPSSTAGDGFRFPNASDNGFVDDMSPFGYQSYLKEDRVSHSFASEPSRVLDPRLEVLKKSVGSVASLRELVRFYKFAILVYPIYLSFSLRSWIMPLIILILQCAIEGLGLAFQTQPQLSANPGKTEIYAQVAYLLLFLLCYCCLIETTCTVVVLGTLPYIFFTHGLEAMYHL